MEHLSLAELNKLIQKTLKDNLEPSYWVVAEIGEMRVNQNGHCYLELIENDDQKVTAKAKATIWSYTYRNLSTWFLGVTGQPLSEGLKILANVKISFHELYGFSLNIQDIDASYTIGEKERQKQAVINKLREDGVFDMNKELDLPLVPQQIAVISSPTAAGYGDFMEQITGNPYNYAINTTLFSATMQGNDAPASIIAALHQINERGDFDLVVLIRGGGSQLDLECFDDYDLCSHIAQFTLPVVTGIGHERDETIADLVAHTKLKTPTAVAEFIIQGISVYDGTLDELADKIGKSAIITLQQASLTLQQLQANIQLSAKTVVMQQQHLLQSLTDTLKHRAGKQLHDHQQKLANIEALHSLMNPQTIFKRGYSLSTVNGKAIAKTKAKAGQTLQTYTLNQIIESKIQSVKNNDEI